jgi:hypothetical protein
VRLIFGPFPSHLKEQDRIFSNLIAIQSPPIPSKHLIHVKKLPRLPEQTGKEQKLMLGAEWKKGLNHLK